MKNRWIYHLSRQIDLKQSETLDIYSPSKEDGIDGFMHFSTAKQIAGSAAKHRSGETNLFLLEVDSRLLNNSLKWEPNREGDFFPHFFAPLKKEYVTRILELPINSKGIHIFPKLKDEEYP